MSNTTKFSEEELNQLRNLFPSDNNITDSIEEVSETVPEADSQITRTVGQGFFSGFGDEIEAGIRSVFPESLGGGEYKKIRDELRKELRDYKAQNPNEALTSEVVGGILQGVALAYLTKGKSIPYTVANMTKANFAQSLASSLGFSEKDIEEFGTSDIMKTGAETGIAGVIGTSIEAVLSRFAGPLSAQLIKTIKNKLSKAPSNEVQAELYRILQNTKRNPDETNEEHILRVIKDIKEGRTISSNEDLITTINAFKLDSPELKKFITTSTKEQATKTTNALKDKLFSVLAPDADDKNLIIDMEKKIKARKDKEAEFYDDLFVKTNPKVSDSISEALLDGIERFPAAEKSLQKILRSEKIPPLFKVVDEEFVLTRTPTLEDAELFRRNLKEIAGKSFKEGEGRVGRNAVKAEEMLRTALDDFSPELALTRENYSKLMKDAEAFEYGTLKANSANVDEFIAETRNYSPEEINALRVGILSSLQNRLRVNPVGTLRDLKDNEKNLGQILETFVPPEQLDDILKSIDTAYNANVVKSKTGIGGSQTKPLGTELDRIGSNVSGLSQIVQGTNYGNIPQLVSGFINIASNVLPEANKLNSEQKEQVVRILFNEDPDFVKKVLDQSLPATEIINTISPVIRNVLQFTPRGVSVPSVQQFIQPDVEEEQRTIVPKEDTMSSIPARPPQTQITGTVNPQTEARMAQLFGGGIGSIGRA
jgi:hypothetical protein